MSSVHSDTNRRRSARWTSGAIRAFSAAPDWFHDHPSGSGSHTPEEDVAYLAQEAVLHAGSIRGSDSNSNSISNSNNDSNGGGSVPGTDSVPELTDDDGTIGDSGSSDYMPPSAQVVMAVPAEQNVADQIQRPLHRSVSAVEDEPMGTVVEEGDEHGGDDARSVEEVASAVDAQENGDSVEDVLESSSSQPEGMSSANTSEQMCYITVLPTREEAESGTTAAIGSGVIERSRVTRLINSLFKPMRRRRHPHKGVADPSPDGDEDGDSASLKKVPANHCASGQGEGKGNGGEKGQMKEMKEMASGVEKTGCCLHIMVDWVQAVKKSMSD